MDKKGFKIWGEKTLKNSEFDNFINDSVFDSIPELLNKPINKEIARMFEEKFRAEIEKIENKYDLPNFNYNIEIDLNSERIGSFFIIPNDFRTGMMIEHQIIVAEGTDKFTFNDGKAVYWVNGKMAYPHGVAVKET